MSRRGWVCLSHFGVAMKCDLKVNPRVLVKHCNTTQIIRRSVFPPFGNKPSLEDIPTEKVSLTRKTLGHLSSSCLPSASVKPAADWTHDRGSLSMWVRKPLLTASRGQRCGLDRARGCSVSGDKLLWSVIHGKTRSQHFILHTVNL